MDWLVAAIIIGIAAFLAAQRSTFLVDYVVIVYVFNRGLRRLLDYNAGAFNPIFTRKFDAAAGDGSHDDPVRPEVQYRCRNRQRTILTCLFVAIGYAFLVGFARIQFAAVYSLAEVMAPIAMFGYILTLSPSQDTKDRWLRTSAWCAIRGVGIRLVPVYDHPSVGRVLGSCRRIGGLSRNFGTYQDCCLFNDV